jgi:inositol oxygenase
MRRDGKPDWMQVVGLIHDLGKLLYFYLADPQQWSVVGDTFPVGCAFAEQNIYPETFASNPDYRDPRYSSALGIYEEHCGLDNVMMSWGHDEVRHIILCISR